MAYDREEVLKYHLGGKVAVKFIKAYIDFTYYFLGLIFILIPLLFLYEVILIILLKLFSL